MFFLGLTISLMVGCSVGAVAMAAVQINRGENDDDDDDRQDY